MHHVLSLGAGVQSSTLALMAAAGEVTPMPTVAIFADTQAEPPSVYAWLDWLEKQLPFPVHRVTAGDLASESVRLHTSKKTGNVYTKLLVPAYIANPDGGRGIFGRRCTSDFKVLVIHKALKQLNLAKARVREIQVTQWIGISTDEAHRMKPSREAWSEHRWPLIEQGYSRQGCLEWMQQRGFPEPPRSACVFCPFHGDAEWARLKRDEPEQFARAVQFERELQESQTKRTGTARLRGVPYLHNSLIPLDQVRFGTLPERHQLSLFGNECEGLCGV